MAMQSGDRSLPELTALDAHTSLVRIPPETDVPVTPRIRRLIDSAAFRRLATVSQLGLVALVYPGARHTRFEHSLGVYRNALLYLKKLNLDPRFQALVTREDQELFLVAALLHDIGHWPFCHPIEDMALGNWPRHEVVAAELLAQTDLSRLLRDDWSLDPRDVAALLARQVKTPPLRLLSTML
ncbi:MAG TPA: HD domain-containing protein, partial [Pirellulaceae bacterium]